MLTCTTAIIQKKEKSNLYAVVKAHINIPTHAFMLPRCLTRAHGHKGGFPINHEQQYYPAIHCRGVIDEAEARPDCGGAPFQIPTWSSCRKTPCRRHLLQLTQCEASCAPNASSAEMLATEKQYFTRTSANFGRYFVFPADMHPI